jgi:hypothetical protein
VLPVFLEKIRVISPTFVRKKVITGSSKIRPVARQMEVIVPI